MVIVRGPAPGPKLGGCAYCGERHDPGPIGYGMRTNELLTFEQPLPKSCVAFAATVRGQVPLESISMPQMRPPERGC